MGTAPGAAAGEFAGFAVVAARLAVGSGLSVQCSGHRWLGAYRPMASAEPAGCPGCPDRGMPVDIAPAAAAFRRVAALCRAGQSAGGAIAHPAHHRCHGGGSGRSTRSPAIACDHRSVAVACRAIAVAVAGRSGFAIGAADLGATAHRPGAACQPWLDPLVVAWRLQKALGLARMDWVVLLDPVPAVDSSCWQQLSPHVHLLPRGELSSPGLVFRSGPLAMLCPSCRWVATATASATMA